MTKIKNELISHTDLYVWTQINFAYHSNKIEGSHLSKNQTKQIFETKSGLSGYHSLTQENISVEH